METIKERETFFMNVALGPADEDAAEAEEK
jgi:hypothetical protein